MRLDFKEKHLSIDQFNSVEIPNFTVITGANGSGKSHLLEAIENGRVLINGDSDLKIVRFDYREFYLENEASYNAVHINQEKDNAWSFLINNIKPSVESARKSIFGDDYRALALVSETKSIPFWNLAAEDIDDVELARKHKQYKKKVGRFFTQHGDNQQAQSVNIVMKKLHYSIDEIARSDFDLQYQPYQLKKDFLPSQLGRVIWDYFLKYRTNEVNEFMNEKYGKSYPVITETEFKAKYGEKPWVVINTILEKFKTVEYRLPQVEGEDYFGNYQVRLKHVVDDVFVDFSALSSGEKVLMALIASVYKSSTDNYFPDLLLLDEVDASLHPSMMKNLLETIQDVFLSRGTQVILVTHSPTTVAYAPDDSVYVMNKRGLNRIEKKTKNDALAILTEGFATLDEGLRLFDEVSRQDISIISEGNNIGLIRKALELYQLQNIDVIAGVEGSSGKSQLKTIFDFFSKVPHDKKVIIVWDCDAQNSLEAVGNTYPFIFAHNPRNKLSMKGIENLFDESLQSNYIATRTNSDGVVTKEFDGNKKREFAEFVISRNNIDDFKLFNPLIDYIQSMREANS